MFAPSYLITANGDVSIGDADPFFADSYAIDAVIARGDIELLLRQGHLRIRLRPSLTSVAAHSRLVDWLNLMSPPRVLICTFVNKRWNYEFLQNGQRAARHVDRVMERHGGGAYSHLRRRQRSFGDSRNAAGVLAALEFWRAKRLTFDPAGDIALLDPLLESRWLLLDTSEYRVLNFGKSNSPYVSKWLKTNVGAPLETAPDSLYSRDCVATYRAIEQTHQPLMEDVDALATWGSFGRVRSRYCRLMLPFGDRWLFVSTAIDAEIDLID